LAETYDLVIIGMGSAGIVAAEFATTIGLRVAAVERDRIGGDCLWTGCVPSKSLLASARVAHQMRVAERYGLPSADPAIDHAAVWRRMHEVRNEIATTDDSPERFEQMGIELLEGEARVTGPRTIEVAGRRLETRFVLVCTGSKPAVPDVPGLRQAGFLTSETIFHLERPPRSFIVIGGGPAGTEMAQALRRLGIEATVLQRRPRLLMRDEPELAETLTKTLHEDGVDVQLGVDVRRVTVENGSKVVYGGRNGSDHRWAAEEILVAVGRRPNVGQLGLAEVGVEVGPSGVKVDERLRTDVPSIYAAGDVTGRFAFTHAAAYEAVIALRNMFFPGSERADELVPWCTFTDPELAHVGLTSEEAGERHRARHLEVRRFELTHSDRARTDGATRGALVFVTIRGRLVGAHVLAPSAGEMIHELAQAVQSRKRPRDLTSLVHVYPTFSTSIASLSAEAAFERARRYRWLVRLGLRRRPRAG
jgi:pyruvate/2-oxoglutarate dehydrogenase complex dihydrolipoamide dehydrogenase (E3) component